MFRLVVPPASCGRKVVRSVALRIPSFSMSCGRYVSTGFGPVSSAVGMFDPVTITRSATASPAGAGAAGAGNWANETDAQHTEFKTVTTQATQKNQSLFITFFIISFSMCLDSFALLLWRALDF